MKISSTRASIQALLVSAFILMVSCSRLDCNRDFILSHNNFNLLAEIVNQECNYVSIQRISRDSLTIALDVLKHSDAIKVLSIRRCQLDSIPKQIEAMALEKLIIENCGLQYVNLAGLPNGLLELQVSRNEVDSLVGICQTLKILDISNNKIDYFPYDLVRRSEALISLNLSDNDIRNIETDSLKNGMIDIYAYGNPFIVLDSTIALIRDSLLVLERPPLE